jgi:hypothetical protein
LCFKKKYATEFVFPYANFAANIYKAKAFVKWQSDFFDFFNNVNEVEVSCATLARGYLYYTPAA